MARTRKRQTPKSRLEPITDVAGFRRLLHSGSDLSKAISASRHRLKPEYVPEIVAQLGAVNVYRGLLAPGAFPRSYSEIKPGRAATEVEPATEALWTASVLSLHVDRLCIFVELRDEYYDSFMGGHYHRARRSLDRVESEFGFSLWSIASRLSLLQLESGTAAQKEFFEKLVGTIGINPFVAYLSFLFSYRAEPNVSEIELSRELNLLTRVGGLPPNRAGYIRYHAHILSMCEVNDPWSCLSQDTNSPIVDRFQVLLDMALLATVRSPSDKLGFLEQALSLISKVPDNRIRNLLYVLQDGKGSATPWVDENLLVTLDQDTLGRYDIVAEAVSAQLRVHPAAAVFWEIGASSRDTLNSGFESLANDSLLDRALASISSMSALEGQIIRAGASLQKIAVLTRGHAASAFIPAFLERTLDLPIAESATEGQAIWALCSPANNPTHFRIWRDLSPTVLQGVLKIARQKPSPTVSLFETALGLRGGNDGALVNVPTDREQLFRGFASYNEGDYPSALKSFELSIQGRTASEATRRSNAIYNTLRKLGRLSEALDLFVRLYLANENTRMVLPLIDLAKWCAQDKLTKLGDSLERTIVFHVYSIHVGNRFDKEFSDAFEDVLEHFGVMQPTELLNSFQSFSTKAARLIYYFRHVCSIRRLEDMEFETYDDVEQERILILQGLLDIDPDQQPEYASEIRSISKEAEIARLTAEFERSKIYVNEVGALEAIHDEMFDAYARYVELSAKPDLERSVEGIERRMKQLFRSPSFELPELKLPSTERNALFSNTFSLGLAAFVFSPSHGLRTYLSTRILHGALEGELRSSFSARNILYLESSSADIIAEWGSKMRLSPGEWSAIRVALVRFGKRIAEVTGNLKDELIRIRSKETPQGLFNFDRFDGELSDLQKTISASADYREFTSKLFAHYWERVESSLVSIRAELRGPFCRTVDNAVEALLRNIEAAARHSETGLLRDAVTHARTDFGFQLERIVGWFARAGSPPTSPISVETLVGAARAITNNCWPKQQLTPILAGNPSLQLRGDVLLPLLEVLTNCFQNAIEHSGFARQAPQVRVRVLDCGPIVNFMISNNLDTSTSSEAKRRELGERLAQCFSAAAPAMAAREDGTGFPTIQRVLVHEIDGGNLSAGVNEEGWVEVSFDASSQRILHEHPAR